MRVQVKRGTRAYNRYLREHIPVWADRAAVVTSAMACDACHRLTGAFLLHELPELPHVPCQCGSGCSCYYAILLTPPALQTAQLRVA